MATTGRIEAQWFDFETDAVSFNGRTPAFGAEHGGSSPSTAATAPFQGRTPRSRHSSWTGAQSAQETRSANLVALRQLWRQPLTINDVAAITGLPVASVCSLKARLGEELTVVDFETVYWGAGRKATKRARWKLREGR